MAYTMQELAELDVDDLYKGKQPICVGCGCELHEDNSVRCDHCYYLEVNLQLKAPRNHGRS